MPTAALAELERAVLGGAPVRVKRGNPARWGLIVLAGVLLTGLVLVPLVAVFSEAFAQGAGPFAAALAMPDTLAAIRLTLFTAAVAVPANVVFGVAASWLLAHHAFPGKGVLLALIDLPLSVSPVVAGLLFVLLFGAQGLFGAWLSAHHVRILFAGPGIALATTFVTFPFVARQVLPALQAQGQDPEHAALTLGASGWQVLWHVTLPKVRWALLYGTILCNARAMGEFGAVSVVSGHIRGETNTMPLQVEILYNDYDSVGAFALAALLVLMALATLALKKWVEHREAHP